MGLAASLNELFFFLPCVEWLARRALAVRLLFFIPINLHGENHSGSPTLVIILPLWNPRVVRSTFAKGNREAGKRVRKGEG